MSADDRASLGEGEFVDLALRHPLDAAGGEAGFVYFMESGIASVVAGTEGRAAVELGIIGREGMTGLGVVYGDDQHPFQTFIQVEGSAQRFPMAGFKTALETRPAMRALMLRYARAFSIQVATTALANGRSKLDERLCRWLLMVSDRVGRQFSITHEFIALMLAVRRSGVTLAIQILEGKGLIRASRGSITIVDREGLTAMANGAYGFAEREYKRLIG